MGIGTYAAVGQLLIRIRFLEKYGAVFDRVRLVEGGGRNSRRGHWKILVAN